MSSKKVKGFFQAVKEKQAQKGRQGGRQPKMDTKGKPVEYWESRHSIGLRKQKEGKYSIRPYTQQQTQKLGSRNNNVPLAQKGPHNIDKMPKVQISPEQAKKMIERLHNKKK